MELTVVAGAVCLVARPIDERVTVDAGCRGAAGHCLTNRRKLLELRAVNCTLGVVLGYVLNEDLILVGDAVGGHAVRAAAEVILCKVCSDPDGLTIRLELAEVEVAVFAGHCGIVARVVIQHIARVRRGSECAGEARVDRDLVACVSRSEDFLELAAAQGAVRAGNILHKDLASIVDSIAVAVSAEVCPYRNGCAYGCL